MLLDSLQVPDMSMLNKKVICIFYALCTDVKHLAVAFPMVYIIRIAEHVSYPPFIIRTLYITEWNRTIEVRVQHGIHSWISSIVL